jgi:hypoxanthine phosphoribosyltransferase
MKARPAVLWSEEEVRDRVHALGGEIGKAFEGREIAVVGLMKSCLVFMADLIRAIPLDMTCHLLRASALKGEGIDPRTDITYESPIPYAGRDVLILDDIVDTGITLNFLLDQIREHKPRTLKVCALIYKPGDRKVDVRPDWAAFTLDPPRDDEFLVGYGLDHAEAFRGLPYIGTIPRLANAVGGRRTNTLPPGGSGGKGPQEA